MSEDGCPTLCVLGLAPVLTVTAEQGTGGRETDVHIHAGADELVSDGYAASSAPDDLEPAARRLADDGIRSLVITRAEEPLFAWLEGCCYQVEAPSLEVVDPRGAGDATTAALAVGLRRGLGPEEMLRLAAAAGAASVARHGLASAERPAIDRLAERVSVSRLYAEEGRFSSAEKPDQQEDEHEQAGDGQDHEQHDRVHEEP